MRRGYEKTCRVVCFGLGKEVIYFRKAEGGLEGEQQPQAKRS